MGRRSCVDFVGVDWRDICTTVSAEFRVKPVILDGFEGPASKDSTEKGALGFWPLLGT